MYLVNFLACLHARVSVGKGLKPMLTNAIRTALHRYPVARGRSRLTQALSKWSVPPPGTVVPFDRDLQIELCEEQFVSRQIFWFGIFEPREANVFRSAVKRGMTVVDVGANVGQYTLLAAKRVGPEGYVHTFEPASRNFAVLKRNVERVGFHDRVKLNKMALGSRPHQTNLVLTPDGGSNWISEGDKDPADTLERVECGTLDDYLFANRMPVVHLIKIDAEGSDLEVLKGAVKTLERDAPLLFVEFAARCLTRFGATPEEMLKFLLTLGYRPHAMTAKGIEPLRERAALEGNMWLQKN